MIEAASLVGKSLSHYQVLEKIGEGGMGMVYRAHDERLGREVALKVLPEAFAQDPERLARFKREAQLLASLNHPHIAAIYGFEEADGHRYLVLEYVPGETLAEVLKSGPLALEDALGVCRQIAEGLEAAHDKGIIHRDLKPANIKVTSEDKVKILDFGLAKAFVGEELARDISDSPTVTSGSTREGIILGTAAYMSPEQARGKPVDKRTDIWSFGCVLYEALTAQRAFKGETLSDALVSVLKTEPDWAKLPDATPASLRVLLRHCLEKSRDKRLRDAGDARIEIEDALSGAPATAVAIAVRPSTDRKARWILALAGAVTTALITSLFAGTPFGFGCAHQRFPPLRRSWQVPWLIHDAFSSPVLEDPKRRRTAGRYATRCRRGRRSFRMAKPGREDRG
jgi:serine/threonine protein kinase